jgi:hypothetical protein
MSAEDILQSERLSEIARNTTSDKIDTHSKNPDKLSPFSKGCDVPNISSENPDKLSPSLENPDNLSGFTAKNPDNLSPKPLINAAVNINNIKLTAAALINGYPDNLSGFTEQNPDNLSPFLENPDNLSGFAKKPDDAPPLPEEIKNSLEMFGWRGSLADVEKAWWSDPERVRQWLWYARKNGWSGALLRTVLRNDGEYPPELDPSSDQSRRRYVEGPYAEFIEH